MGGRTLLLVLLPGALGALGGCDSAQDAGYQGYVEGEYLYLSAPQPGFLDTLATPRGSRVGAGQTLFVIASEPDGQALSEAEARAQAAREKVENLKAPRRAPEVAALEAELEAALAGLRLSRARLQQQTALAAQRFVSRAALDDARSAFDRAAAQVDVARQQLASVRASVGRQSEVRGAEADLRAATAVVEQKRWAAQMKTVLAPVVGEVSETYYRPGEWVPAGAAVVSLLPDDRRRLRFFVPESALAGLKPGQVVEAGCDGCSAAVRATIDFIAPQAEYTPPVIYSRGSREKLVFRVEAVPEHAAELRPGLPVDVHPVAR
ncbi:HlyD family efflux transporter periplasmic adaptor subunit [Azoarcus sp. L1K30]|nr:HlyD family efflux transporter periplasmic adaptor subunit [Azoarcus sp. L1K30]